MSNSERHLREIQWSILEDTRRDESEKSKENFTRTLSREKDLRAVDMRAAWGRVMMAL